MATSIHMTTSRLLLALGEQDEPKPVRRRPVRPCMLISVGLILAGMGLVFLMLLEVLPLSFLLALAGFFLTGTGGVTALIFCGEI